MVYLIHVINCCRQSLARKTQEISFLPVLSCRCDFAGDCLCKMVHLGSGPVKASIARRGTRTLPSKRRHKGKGFEINRASVLGFRTTGRGHTDASNTLSFLGLKTKTNIGPKTQNNIEAEAKNMLESELNQAAFEDKERKFALDLLD